MAEEEDLSERQPRSSTALLPPPLAAAAAAAAAALPWLVVSTPCLRRHLLVPPPPHSWLPIAAASSRLRPHQVLPAAEAAQLPWARRTTCCSAEAVASLTPTPVCSTASILSALVVCDREWTRPSGRSPVPSAGKLDWSVSLSVTLL